MASRSALLFFFVSSPRTRFTRKTVRDGRQRAEELSVLESGSDSACQVPPPVRKSKLTDAEVLGRKPIARGPPARQFFCVLPCLPTGAVDRVLIMRSSSLPRKIRRRAGVKRGRAIQASDWQGRLVSIRCNLSFFFLSLFLRGGGWHYFDALYF